LQVRGPGIADLKQFDQTRPVAAVARHVQHEVHQLSFPEENLLWWSRVFLEELSERHGDRHRDLAQRRH